MTPTSMEFDCGVSDKTSEKHFMTRVVKILVKGTSHVENVNVMGNRYEK